MKCKYMIEVSCERRPGNALNIEIGSPLARCILKTPENWVGTPVTAGRWLFSGGSALIFGICSNNCPKNN